MTVKPDSLLLLSDFQRFWCTVDQFLLLYESDRASEPCVQISVRNIVCVGVARPDASTNNNGFIDRFGFQLGADPSGLTSCCDSELCVLFWTVRFRYTFELYLTSEKLHLFGLETADELHSWTRAIGQVRTHNQGSV